MHIKWTVLCYVTCGHMIFMTDVSHGITATSYDKKQFTM